MRSELGHFHTDAPVHVQYIVDPVKAPGHPCRVGEHCNRDGARIRRGSQGLAPDAKRAATLSRCGRWN